VNKILRTIGIIIVIALIVTVANGFYVLEEGKQAIITQFGRPVGQPITEAGLHFKTPYVQEATYFEKKILIWDGDPNQIPTNDKTFVYLDVTARWRITDALVFLQAVNNETRAQTILDDIIDGTVRDLVNFLAYMGEPIKLERQSLGIKVMLFLFVLFIFAYLLKKEYWKDIH